KSSYTTAEFGRLIRVSNWYARELCRKGRVHATKANSGRGRSCEWRISHQELLRYQKEGLLPLPEKSSIKKGDAAA
ncbi:MAG: hypothetical protein ABSD28_21535, partial [Tepidisphaeraceae bacterium]